MERINKPHWVPVDLKPSELKKLGLRNWPGWNGGFTRQQAPGAIPNGARVARSDVRENGDITPEGTGGTVLGSFYIPDQGYAYFVEFDNRPKTAIFVVAVKIRAL